jgi:hypothetical protein
MASTGDVKIALKPDETPSTEADKASIGDAETTFVCSPTVRDIVSEAQQGSILGKNLTKVGFVLLPIVNDALTDLRSRLQEQWLWFTIGLVILPFLWSTVSLFILPAVPAQVSTCLFTFAAPDARPDWSLPGQF